MTKKKIGGIALSGVPYCDFSVNFCGWYCTKISAGCKNCYMINMANSFGKAETRHNWREGAVRKFTWIPPGAVVFIGDMYDIYHEDMPMEYIRRTHQLIARRPDITCLMLSKRIERLPQFQDEIVWADNMWLGTTIENQDVSDGRLRALRNSPAKHLWLSCEPLLGSVNINLKKIGWVICGGESGENHRWFDIKWAKTLMDNCEKNNVPFYFKQRQGKKPGHNPVIDGKTMQQYPVGVSPLRYRAEKAKPQQLELF